MYADDLIVISISVCDMQYLVDLCVSEFNNIGLEINISKSACLRVGLRHSAPVGSIKINNYPLNWVKGINYLGIKILCSKKFTVNLQFMKQKYFRSLNGIFGKVGLKTSPLVLISLINSYCVQNLLYCAESFWWSKSMLNSCENAYALAFMKVFRSYDKKIIEQCQYYMGQLPLELQIINRQINFFANVNK